MTTFYVDGSCLGNGQKDRPTPGGWAILNLETLEVKRGYAENTTNQQAELRAVALALENAPPGDEVHLYTDSMFVIAALMGRIKLRDVILKAILEKCRRLAEERDLHPVLHKNKGKRSRPALAVDRQAKLAAQHAKSLLRENQ